MLAGMSARHLAEWQLMFDEWALGDHPNFRADFRSGIVAATVGNFALGKKGTELKPTDFLPTFTAATPADQALYDSMGRLAERPPRPARKTATRPTRPQQPARAAPQEEG